MSTVVVKARFCDKTHRITVRARDDGDLDLIILSDCEHVLQYAENIGPTITLSDVTEREGSIIFDTDAQRPLTMTCLAPIGILDAAWLELGMMSKSFALKVKSDEISYEEVND